MCSLSTKQERLHLHNNLFLLSDTEPLSNQQRFPELAHHDTLEPENIFYFHKIDMRIKIVGTRGPNYL